MESLTNKSATPGSTVPVSGALPSTREVSSTALGRVVLLLWAVHLVIRGWFVLGSYYLQDDYNHLSLARELGLSKEYLIRDYGGHLEPGQYFLIWIFSHFMDESFVFAAVTIIVMQGIASMLLWVVLRELFGRSPALLIPWAIYLFTPLALVWSTWWAAAIQTLPLQICTLIAIFGLSRARRRNAKWWGAVSVLASSCALVLWEKGTLVLPALVAVQLLVIASGGVRERVASLRPAWRMWAAHAALWAGYVVVYLNLVDTGADSSSIDVGTILDGAVARMLVPGLFGGPWHTEGAVNTVYPYTEAPVVVLSLLALAFLVWLSVRVSGRVACAGWLLATGYVVADLALLALGRGDYLSVLARDPRYVADALPIIAIGFAAAFRGIADRPGTKTSQALQERLTVKSSCGIAVALLVSGFITQVQLAPVVQHDYSRDYATAVIQQLEEQPNMSLINSGAPFAVSARTDLEGFLRALGKRYEFDRPGTQMFMLDGFGALRPVQLLGGGEQTLGPVPGCGWVVGSEPTLLTSVDAIPDADADDADREKLVLKLAYVTPAEVDIEVTFGGQKQTLTLTHDAGEAYFVLPQSQDDVQVRVVEGEPICVKALAVGEPWVE